MNPQCQEYRQVRAALLRAFPSATLLQLQRATQAAVNGATPAKIAALLRTPREKLQHPSHAV